MIVDDKYCSYHVLFVRKIDSGQLVTFYSSSSMEAFGLSNLGEFFVVTIRVLIVMLENGSSFASVSSTRCNDEPIPFNSV
jgi:hypothetical protein